MKAHSYGLGKKKCIHKVIADWACQRNEISPYYFYLILFTIRLCPGNWSNNHKR